VQLEVGVELKLEEMEILRCPETGKICVLNGIDERAATFVILTHDCRADIYRETFRVYNAGSARSDADLMGIQTGRIAGRRLDMMAKRKQCAAAKQFEKRRKRIARNGESNYEAEVNPDRFLVAERWRKLVASAFATTYAQFKDVIAIRVGEFVSGRNCRRESKGARGRRLAPCDLFGERNCSFAACASAVIHPATHQMFCSGVRSFRTLMMLAIEIGSPYSLLCRRLLVDAGDIDEL